MTTPPVPSDTDRLANIRARLDAASEKTTMDVHAGRSTLRASVSGGDRGRFIDGMGDLVAATVGETGPLTVTVADDEDGQDATLTLHARDDLAFLLALVDSLRERLDTAEADLAALEPIAAPHRMTAEQRERYRRHASWEGAEHFMKQAEAAARRWQREADWLREFRDERKAETEAGTWPLPGDFDCCERHPARALGLGGEATDE